MLKKVNLVAPKEVVADAREPRSVSVEVLREEEKLISCNLGSPAASLLRDALTYEPETRSEVLEAKEAAVQNKPAPAPPKLVPGRKKKCVTGSQEWKARWYAGMNASFDRHVADMDRRLAAMETKD